MQATVPDGLIAAAIDARGGKLYGALFRKRGTSGGDLELVGEEIVLSNAEYFAWVAQQTGGRAPVFVTPTTEVVKTGLAASPLASARVEEASGDLAVFIGRHGLARAREGRLVDALGLEANYIRRSDAEVKWQGG